MEHPRHLWVWLFDCNGGANYSFINLQNYSIMELYVQAQSKKAINEAISRGEAVTGVNYSIYGGGGSYKLVNCPPTTIVKVFKKYVGGQPYATAYGTWNGKKLI